MLGRATLLDTHTAPYVGGGDGGGDRDWQICSCAGHLEGDRSAVATDMML